LEKTDILEVLLTDVVNKNMPGLHNPEDNDTTILDDSRYSILKHMSCPQ
jgi:hypothetical protein